MIVSTDGASTTAARLGCGVITMVPLTSNVERICPFQVLLPPSCTGLAVDSKAQAEQVRSVDVERIQRRVGSVPPDLMNQLDHAQRPYLAP